MAQISEQEDRVTWELRELSHNKYLSDRRPVSGARSLTIRPRSILSPCLCKLYPDRLILLTRVFSHDTEYTLQLRVVRVL